MKIGYARVSTPDQDLALQLDALQSAGCSTIYQEKITGVKKERQSCQFDTDATLWKYEDRVVFWTIISIRIFC